MKVLAEKDGKDPGFTAFGPEAGEVVAVVQAAMATVLVTFSPAFRVTSRCCVRPFLFGRCQDTFPPLVRTGLAPVLGFDEIALCLADLFDLSA
ncbi:hypothetical protein VT84_24965 [Gemmata sp. SH-PL17]|uniref:hypothetical protein n=1 Tax=Gemmata sp. SH-PL17 TaxID=1630693 RepID=UPI0004B81DB2|nr:hypothetical protein [Gemmata sp. SH-PL17]AMV27676.1 hypothetical protein VT84_24965 [Gemmata sp. SH-PL17]